MPHETQGYEGYRMSVHFSSKSDEWETPRWLFDLLDSEFRFELDAAATVDNRKCSFWFDGDGLEADWHECLKAWNEDAGAWNFNCWMNPPYSNLKAWMKKAYEESLKGCTVVCLIPARTDTVAWHEYAMKGEIRFIRGRLKFGGSKNSAPFPSAIVIFDPPEKARTYRGKWVPIGPTIDARGR